jgi:signal transduction histidine kinase
VQRRGTELGGEAAELGRLAGDQEAALRALVQGDVLAPSTGPRRAGGASTLDLMSALAPLASRTVTVSGPGGEVLLPGDVVDEVRAVVRACLDNVGRHVGPDAPAWVLVERVGDRLLVTVRDEGPGIAPGRLEQAREEGRLGVSESIRGRMAAVGGVADLVTGPGQGTEWELSLAVSSTGAGVHSK